MKAKLQAELVRLDSMLLRAEELADSKREATAERYTNIVDCLKQAIASIEKALEAFDA